MLKRILILSSLLTLTAAVPAFSETKVIANFNSGLTTPLNIGAGSAFSDDNANIARILVSSVTHGNTGYALEIKRRTTTTEYFVFNLGTAKDLSTYRAISFWIKGRTGDGSVRFKMNFESDACYGANPGRRPYVDDFIDGGISTEWKKVVVPVSSLFQNVTSTNIVSINRFVFSFDSATSPTETLYIDDIILHTKCAPIHVNEFETASGNNSFVYAIGGGADTYFSRAYCSTTSYQGNQSLAVNYQLSGSGWGAVYEEKFCEDFVPATSIPLDISACDQLEIALQRGFTSGASINPSVELWEQSGVCVGHSAAQAIDSTFKLYSVPIASLDNSYSVNGATDTKLIKIFYYGGATNSTCFVDSIKFVNNSTPTAPTAFLQNGEAITDGFTISTTSILQVTADAIGSNSLMERVRFEHDGLSGGQTWYTIGVETDTIDGTYYCTWISTSLLSGTTYQIRAVAENINRNYALTKLINCKNDIPPAAITDITAAAWNADGSVRLRWTAPGENGAIGTLNNGQYLIKISSAYISTAAFDSITLNAPYSYSIQLATTSVNPYDQQSYVLTGLNPGTTYFFAMKAQDPGTNWSVWGGTSASVNPLSFGPAGDLAPSAVVTVTSLQGSNMVSLVWAKPPVPVYYDDYSKYWVYRATESFTEAQKTDPYVSVAATVTYNALQNPVTAQMLGLDNYTTYFFHISVIDSGVQNGLYSLAIESFSVVETSTMTVLAPPEAPTGFYGVVLSTYQITWNWSDSPNDDGYRVKFASSPADSASPDQAKDAVSWTESTLTPNLPFGRCAVAFNAAGPSGISNTATYFTLANPPLSPVISGITKSSFTITWSANNNPNGTRYGVAYSSAGYYVSVSTPADYASALTPNTTALYNLIEGATYYLRVWAYNNDQIATSPLTVSTRTIQTLPPTTFQGVAYSSYSVCWTWSGVVSADGYSVRHASNPATTPSGNLAHTATYYLETGLAGNARYGRGAVSHAAWYTSALSNTATVYTLTNPPVGQSVSDVGLSTITVSWTANGNPSARYGLSYTADETYAAGVSTPINFNTNFTALTTTYIGLSASTTYFFHIWTYNEDQIASGYVETSTKTIDGPPLQPSGFAGTAVSSTSIQWAWTDVNGETGYRVNFASSPSQVLTASGNLAASGGPTVNWTENSLSPNRPYGRAVAAFNIADQSPLSDSATVYTLASAPQSLAVSNVVTSSITLTWSSADNPPNTRFGVSYSTTSLQDVVVSTVVKYSNNLTVNTTNMLYLANGTSYYFRVWAYNEDQRSSPVITISTKTIQTNTPAGFAGAALSTASIRWTWSNVANEDGFRVKSATEPATSVSPNIAANTLQWDETGLLPNRALGRGVVSIASGFESLISNTTTVYTLANPPVSPSTSSVLTTSIGLTWGANSNADGTHYGLAYSSVGYYVSVTTPVNYASNNTAVSATISSLTKSATYYIRVWAYNNDQLITSGVQVSSVCTLSYMDTTAPVFSGVTEIDKTYFLNKDIKIDAAVTDDEEVAGANLNYRTGSGAWHAVAMTEGAGGTIADKTYSAVIPGPAVTGDYIYYYLDAVDGNSNTGLWSSSSSAHAIEIKQEYKETITAGTVSLPDANSDDGVVSVLIPDGALKNAVQVIIKPMPASEVTSPPSSSETTLPASVYEFGPSGTNFRKPVTITLLFSDISPKDGIEDNLGVDVGALRVFWWDGTEWRLMGGKVNDRTSADASLVNTVSVQTMHFSKFALFPLKAGVTAAFKPKEKIITPAAKDGHNDVAQFDGLAGEDVIIDIYDIQGRKIRSINVLREGNTWNGLDGDGFMVESGAYIFQFTYKEKLYSGTIIVAK